METYTTIDILGDESYPRKRADAELVVAAVNNHHVFLTALQQISELDPADPDNARYAVEISKKAIAKVAETKLYG
jgi:hypothetical protein